MNDNTKNDGGQAFPQADRVGDIATQHGGMTLRDYFAAKAMQGYVSDEEWRDDIDFDGTARAAYKMADAMIAARGEMK